MIINRYIMIKSLSHSVIALTLILGFAPIVKPISVSEANNNLYAQATTTDEEKLETANRLLQEGLALYKQGTKESLLQALAKFQEALPILREVNYPSGEGATLFRIGGVYYDLGKKQKALDYYNQTLPLFPAVENRQLEAATINNIGDVYDDLGEKQKALDYYNQSLPISQAVGDRQLEATTLNNIGRVYDNLGEKQKALDYYNQSLPISQAVGDRQLEAATINNIGAFYDSLGEKQKALDYCNQALTLFRAVGDRQLEATTLNNIGDVYDDLGEKQKALDYYNQALPIFRAVGNRQGKAATLNNIGAFYDSLGEKQKALDYYNQALPISQAVGDRQLEATTLNNIGLVYNNLGEKQKASYFSTVEDDYKFKTQILMQLHQQNPDRGYDVLAFETSEQGKARSLLELLEEANIDIRQGVAPELVTEEKRLQNKLDAIERQRISFCSQNCSQRLLNRLETERSKLVEQYKQVQAKIRANSPEYAELTQPQPIKLKQLQQLLDEDTVLWQYSLWRDRSYVWVISKDSFSTHELASREEIETLAREYHKLLQHESRDNKLNSVATKLSQFITPPTAEATQKSRIVIVSDAALQYIPFASLPTEDDRLLSNNHQIVNLPSSSVLARLRTNQENQIPATKKLAILADPVFSKSDIRLPQKQQPGTEDFGYDPLKSATRSLDLKLSRLKGTKKEAETIRDLVPESQKISAFGFDANLQFATSPELSNYNIVHFATHGILNSEKPELSGIVLSLFDEKGNPQNGFLRLHEVFNLDLPADLVVLSAYETGLGKEIRGEGLVGLTRGFMYAGATRLLVSLWKVNDAATAEFMSEFYSFILQDGLTPAEALNATQKYMQQHPDWNHPYYWAAFTLQGDWLSFDRTKR